MASEREAPDWVMVVDDDDDIRDIVIELLEHNDVTAVGAVNGADALAKLTDGRSAPRLIILDLMMPFLDGAGFRAAQMANGSLASIPVVVMSADVDVVRKAAAIGVRETLRKPVHLADLLSTVRRYAPPRA